MLGRNLPHSSEGVLQMRRLRHTWGIYKYSVILCLIILSFLSMYWTACLQPPFLPMYLSLSFLWRALSNTATYWICCRVNSLYQLSGWILWVVLIIRSPTNECKERNRPPLREFTGSCLYSMHIQEIIRKLSRENSIPKSRCMEWILPACEAGHCRVVSEFCYATSQQKGEAQAKVSVPELHSCTLRETERILMGWSYLGIWFNCFEVWPELRSTASEFLDVWD